MPELLRATVTRESISVTELSELVSDDACGAVVVFSGVVRNHDGGKEVIKLTYEIHPSASEQIELITKAVLESADVVKVAVSHRYGDIDIGDVAFAVAVSAVHRQSAFDTASLLVNEIKAKLPIWKHQLFADGSDEWVNTA